MKKNTALFLIFILFFTFSACSKTDTDNNGTTEATNPPPYTTVINGKTYSAQKLNSQSDDYQIGYYDENKLAVRFEYYKDSELSYYYISSGFDKNGNDQIQKYYSADGKLLGTVDNGKFYNANGKEISESDMGMLLPS